MALILRVVPPARYSIAPHLPSERASLTDFFELDWVNARGSRAEILFLHREKGEGPEATRSAAREAHVAFPGGRMEEGDEGGLYTGTKSFNPLAFVYIY